MVRFKIKPLFPVNVPHLTVNSCGKCGPGWLLLNTTCYFHSKSASLPLRNWWESRADCTTRGGNLAVIDNIEEQYLPKLDPSIRPWWKSGGTWIGLSDAHAEGNWVWINNVTQEHGKGYWIQGEPNNYGPSTGEDCAAFVNIKNPRQTWYDASCSEEKHWLCETEPNT
uniref:C-type lectin domain-containing protein n=1 Tax=Tetraodon nigroviridis TaxID=99883 RepID=H3C434_TETNG